MPVWVLYLGIVLFVFLGVLWTGYNRRARAESERSRAAVLDEINQKGIKTRDRIERHLETRDRSAPATPLTPVPPSSALMEMISRCDRFSTEVTARIPARFQQHLHSWALQEFPSLRPAVAGGFFTFDPPLSLDADPTATYADLSRTSPDVTVQMTPRGTSMLTVVPVGDSWEISLGRRKVRSASRFFQQEREATAQFEWEFENPQGTRLMPQIRDFHGTATFRLLNGDWALAAVEMWDVDSRATVCSW